MEKGGSVEHLLSLVTSILFMMPGECPNALCLMYGVEKCPKSQKCPKVPKVLKSTGPVNYNYQRVLKKLLLNSDFFLTFKIVI